jgi:hypothetical protein
MRSSSSTPCEEQDTQTSRLTQRRKTCETPVEMLWGRAAFAIAVGLSLSMLISASSAADSDNKIIVPEIPGLDVKVGETVLIKPGNMSPFVFQFSGGRIRVDDCDMNRWTRLSSDGGRTWSDVHIPGNYLYGVRIDLGDGQILSLSFATKKRADGKYTLPLRRSLDGWKTVTEETCVLDIPHSVPCGGDGGETNPGFLMDHSILQLKDGRLMATMYGNYDDDKTPADAFPASFHLNKYRTIVVFSSDKGKSWGNPVTVATAPKVSQEGACEAGLARAANGDILCAFRSGGYPPVKSTPCYLCRSTDEGQTWSEPQPILHLGVWPHLCVMRSGIVVCTTGRPGNWLVFSKDDGRTWEGGFCFHKGGPWPTITSYNFLYETAPDTILVIYDREIVKNPGLVEANHEIVGTFFSVRKK